MKTVGAFGLVYFVWGSTFLAIKILVANGDPFAWAALRFIGAGTLMFLWMIARRDPIPPLVEWRNAALVAALMFVCGNGLLFWVETKIDSSLAALVLATIPIWVAVLEVVVFRTAAASPRLIIGCVLGVAGVAAMLEIRWSAKTIGILTLIFDAIAWSLGTVLQRHIRQPRSAQARATIQMLTGGALLAVVAVTVSRGAPHVRWSGTTAVAIGYLILIGSVVTYSAYVWLLGRVSASKVATYAFVNPLVAVVLGRLAAGEHLEPRQWLGAALILSALAVVLSAPLARERANAPARFDVAAGHHVQHDRLAGSERLG